MCAGRRVLVGLAIAVAQSGGVFVASSDWWPEWAPATGVRQVYENVLQLRGQAGDRQVAGVDGKFAVSHNIGGHPTACGIAVLGRQ